MARVDELRNKVIADAERWKVLVAAVQEAISNEEEAIVWLGERFVEALAPLATEEYDGKPLCVIEVVPDEPRPVVRDGVVCQFRPKRIVIDLGRKRFWFSAEISDNGKLKALRSNLQDAPVFVPHDNRLWMIENKYSEQFVISADSLNSLLMNMYDLE